MFWILILGISTGMRTMTAMAVLCWFMWLALLPVTSLNYWTANAIAAMVFTVFALGEYYVDTLAKTPSRKSLGPLLARVVFGVLVGVLVISSFEEPLAGGVILGVGGVLIGAFGGYSVRMYLARLVGRDFPIAVGESALALALSVVALHFIGIDIVRQAHEAMLKISF